MREVVVIGAGIHRYGVFPEKAIEDIGAEAIKNALEDANMEWTEIETAYCGTAQPGISTGHRICQKVGLTGVGIMNVENASASGSSAFREAFLAVASGDQDIAMAFGVDKARVYQKAKADTGEKTKKNGSGKRPFPSPVQIFAEIATQHMIDHGTTIDQLARISVKNHYNGSLNPYAHFQEAVTLEDVHNSRMIADPLTKLHCCPVGDGASAVILCAKEKADQFTDKACPTIISSVLKSKLPDGDALYSLTQYCASISYEKAGIEPTDLDLIELHDAFTIEEIIYAEALGLCETGEGGRLVEEGVTALTGKHPINSSGGLISMGHPIGPTGVGQVAEILWQMRGECGKRQIKKPVNLAMAHMVGAGGVCVIHLFKK